MSIVRRVAGRWRRRRRLILTSVNERQEEQVMRSGQIKAEPQRCRNDGGEEREEVEEKHRQV